jgi:Pyruvate/2-oxoacid:ferredoxin oxidoreductase delta subunit
LPSALNHLGAIGFALFWALAASGVYLYIRFDTSVMQAYASIGEMEWWFGGVLRSMHRYAADAFVVVTLTHLAKELWQGRFRGFRAFSWISGVPLVWLLYASGIVGYWLVWDARAQFSLIATLESLNMHSAGGEALPDRLFSLFVFLHIGLPLALLAGMWIHVQRLGRPATTPPRALAFALVAALLLLSILKPATSEPPADASLLAAPVAVDWLLQFAHPLLYASSPTALWTLLFGLTAVLVALPYLSRKPQIEPARVDPANCNGCARCVADCPYNAVVLEAGKAAVMAERCAGCGICAGACPSSTPFRSVRELVSGIDLPDLTVQDLRRRLQAALPAPEVVFSCEHAGAPGIGIRCLAMLPPAFVEYALRNGARTVRAIGCNPCAYRLGLALAEERFSRQRDPKLRTTVRATKDNDEYVFALR